jgi:tetratricopeptide (TPR) repeat protein
MTRPCTITICILFLAATLAAGSPPAEAAGKTSARIDRGAPAAADSQDPSYWFQKGAVCATYGNNPAAITYFARVIALDPRHSGAYFSQGVAYGQLGHYSQALASINRAIEMKPQNALYFYGRARVYLLSGEKEKALQDFRRAADLGDEDARAYLKGAK